MWVAMLPFAQIPSSILLNPDLSPRAIQVLCLLICHSNGERRSWPKQATIADPLRISKQAVQKLIRELVKAKLVRVDHDYQLPGGMLVTSYVLIYPEIRQLQIDKAQPHVASRQLQVVTRQPQVVARQLKAPQTDNHRLSMEGYTSKVPETTALLGVSASPENHDDVMAEIREKTERAARNNRRG